MPRKASGSRTGQVDLTSSKLVVDTMDEYGVEEALRLRDAGAVSEVVALAVGPTRNEDALRTALAMGVDRAILVEANEYLDVLAVSSVVAQVARAEMVDLIFLGGQQADWDSHALGAATAERLGWPQATWTNALTMSGQELIGRHDVEGGSEQFSLSLPAVITTQQGLNEPRYPTLPNIMKAKRKELRRESIDTFAVHLQGYSAEFAHPGQSSAEEKSWMVRKTYDQVASQLVSMLRTEARIIP